MFSAMMDAIKEESVGFLFNLEVQVDEEAEAERPVEQVEVGPALAQAAAAGSDHPQILAKGLEAPKPPQQLSYSAPTENGQTEVTAADRSHGAEDPFEGISRNALCPCGSGKKYKKCHGAPGGPTGMTTRVNG
jgi:preprotein translocase subunit SecA